MHFKIINSYLPEIYSLKFRRVKPSMVTVNITDKCNQHCIYCEIGQHMPSRVQGILKEEDLFWIIDQMALEKIPKISLCGGEPFLFDPLLRVTNYASSKKIRTSITTNGTTVYKLSNENLLILKKSRTEINISIDSFDNEVNSVTRGSNEALKNALESITTLQRYDIPVTVLTTVSKFNFQNLANFIAKACHLGIRQVLFQPVIYFSNYPERPEIIRKNELNLPVEGIEILYNQLRQILIFERNHNIKTNVYRILPWLSDYLKTASGKNGDYFFENVLKRFYCREVYAIIDIAYDGGIQPCGLRPAFVTIKNRVEKNLINLWKEATQDIKDHLESGKFYQECNGCCHHFSRNMLASMIKFPWANRAAWMEMFPSLILRVLKPKFKT